MPLQNDDEYDYEPPQGGGGGGDEFEYSPAPDPSVAYNHSMGKASEIEPDYLSSLAGDFGRAGIGALKSGGRMAKGLAGAMMPHSVGDAALNVAGFGIPKTMELTGGIIGGLGEGVKHSVGHLKDFKQAQDYRNRLIISAIRNRRMRDLGDAVSAGREELGQLGSAGVALLPGGEELLNTGERAVGGDPEAAGDLGLQLGLNAMGTGAWAARLGSRVESGLGPLLKSPTARIRSLAPASAATDQVASIAIPEMLKRGVMGLSRESLAQKGGDLAKSMGQRLSQARDSVRGRGVQVDFKPALADIQGAVESRSPGGSNWSPGFNNPASEVGGNLDTLMRGGEDAIKRPAAIAESTTPRLLDASGNPIPGPAIPEWKLPDRGPVPVDKGLRAYDALGDSLNEAAYTTGKGGPRANAFLTGRGAMAQDIKNSATAQGVPELADAMGGYHAGKSVEEFTDIARNAAAGNFGAPQLARRLGGAIGAGGLGAAMGAVGSGGAALPAAIGVGGAVAIQSILGSPAWKTVSSVMQHRVAQALKAGDIQRATALANQAVKGKMAGDQADTLPPKVTGDVGDDGPGRMASGVDILAEPGNYIRYGMFGEKKRRLMAEGKIPGMPAPYKPWKPGDPVEGDPTNPASERYASNYLAAKRWGLAPASILNAVAVDDLGNGGPLSPEHQATKGAGFEGARAGDPDGWQTQIADYLAQTFG